MSDKNQETIADIVKEMRGNSEHNHALGEVSKYLNEIADRIEAAAKLEREVGAEKMRENLGEVMHKKYTAQKIREMEAIVASGDIGPMTRENVALMLKQAAEMLDRLDEDIGRESTCEDSSQVGNAAAMRKALEQAKRVLHCAIVADILKGEDARKAFNAVTAALSAPPRNCDKFNTADEAYAGFRKFCDATECSECRFGQNTTTCLLSWLFAEAKGE